MDVIVINGGRKRHSNLDNPEKTGFESITKHHARKKEDNRSRYSNDEVKKALENIPEYMEYVDEHGHHFTNELAEWATDQLINANKKTHKWSAPSIKRFLESNKLPLEGIPVTLGDITYQANLYYSDLSPVYLSDDECIRAAYGMASDPDGYEGIIFCRWISDVMGKKMEVDWEKFI